MMGLWNGTQKSEDTRWENDRSHTFYKHPHSLQLQACAKLTITGMYKAHISHRHSYLNIFYENLGVVRVIPSQWGFTELYSIHVNLGKVGDIVPLVIFKYSCDRKFVGHRSEVSRGQQIRRCKHVARTHTNMNFARKQACILHECTRSQSDKIRSISIRQKRMERQFGKKLIHHRP